MKQFSKSFGLLVCVMQSFSLFATHNLAGEIRVEQFAPLKAKAIIITFTNRFSASADRSFLTINWGDGVSQMIPRTVKQSTDDGNIFRNIYELEHTYSKGGWYTVWMTDPNRNGGILNVNFPNSDALAFHLQTTFLMPNATSNSTNATPILEYQLGYGYVKERFIYKLNATDKDGDKITYRLVKPMSGLNEPIPTYVSPNGIEPGNKNNLSFDEVKGILTWDAPQRVGTYNIAIQIISFRNDVPIDTTLHDMLITIFSDLTATDDLNTNFLKIAPNPISTEGVLTIEDTDLQNGTLIITDILGRMVQIAVLNNKKTFLIQRNGRVKGLYFVQIRNKEKVALKRFLIE